MSEYRRLERVAEYLVFLLVPLILLRPVVLDPGWWIWSPEGMHSDLAVSHWPNAHFTRRAVWQEGQFPIWRPTIMSGAPFAANPLAGLYYPPNWLFLFLPWLPLEVGFNLSALAHLAAAGVAMYGLMRRGLRAGRWGALAAGVVYQASPKLVAHLGAGHVGWSQAWAWLPLVVLCWIQVGRGSGKRRGRWAVAGGAALAILFCADVRMAAYTVLAVATLSLAWVFSWRRPEAEGSGRRNGPRGLGVRAWWPPLAGWGLSVLVFLGLSACQWIPLLAVLPDTTRSAMTMDDAAVWSLPWRYLLGLLLADHGGYCEWMTYAGVSSLVLAARGGASLWRGRPGFDGWRPGRWLPVWSTSLLLGAAWFSLGENGGLFQVLYRTVPGMGLLRVPPRAWVLVVFILAVWAGFGLERAGGMGRVERTLGLVVGLFGPVLVAGYWMTIGTPPWNLILFGAMLPVTLGLLGGWHLTRDGRWLGLVVLVVFVDLAPVDFTLVEGRPPQGVFAGGRTSAEWLAAQPGSFRVYSPSYSLPQHVAERYGLALAGGVDPLQLQVYAEYLSRAAGLSGAPDYGVTLPPFPEGSDVRTALRGVSPDAEMLGQLGVAYVVAAFPLVEGEASAPDFRLIEQFDGTYVYRNRKASPLVEREGQIVLSDGTVLYQYRPWPVYVGWAVSGGTLAGLGVGGLAHCWSRRRVKREAHESLE